MVYHLVTVIKNGQGRFASQKASQKIQYVQILGDLLTDVISHQQ